MSEVITASPNEEEAIRLDEFRRVRLQRLLQVRDAERQRAKSIRCTAEEQVALAKGDLKAKVTREVTLEFRQAMQSTRQRLRSAETSVGESFAAAQQHQEVLAVEARADYEALSRSVHVAAQRHQAAVQVEAAISSESPGAVARQRAQRMTNVRQEAAQESVSWASSRPPVQPKLNELPKPAAARRHKPADASAFHTSHHHFGSGLLYPHSAPNIHVVRHPRSSADTSEVPTISPDESTLSATATAPVSTRNMTPDVGRRALANQHSLAHPLKGAPTTNTSENELFARAWPQPRGMSPSEADDDHPNPLPAPQPRSAPAVALNGSSSATISSLAAIQPRSASPNGSLHHQQRQSHAPHPIHYTVGQFVSSAESSFAAHTASRAATAPAALPLNLVSGDGRLTMSATDIAQRIAELHRVRAIQEEAKLLKQEATIMNRGRNAAAYLRERSEATNANAAVEQLIKETEQSRRQAARVIAPPPGSVTASGSVPENVREKAFERLLFQPAAPKDSASVSARMRDSDAGSRTRNSGKEATASDSVAQPLPSSLSLRGAILRDSSVSSVTSGVVIADVSRERAINVSEASVLSPSKQIVARAVAKPVLSDSDSSSDSLEQSQQQRQPHQQPHSSSSSDSDDLWPPQNSRHTREMPLSKKSSLKMGVGAARAPVVQSSHKNAASNADDVLMSDSSSSSSSLPSSPVRASRTSIVAPASPKAHISLNSHQLSPDTYLSQLQQQHQSYVPHLSQTVVSSLQLSSAPSNIENNWPPSSPPAKPAPAHAGDQRVRTSALLSPQSRISKKLDTVAPLRSSAPASLTSNASNLHPEHSTSAPSPTRAPVSPAHARVRILIPTVPLSPEPAAVIRSPPSSNISTPSDLQSPSLLQRTNILRDLRLSPSKGASFYQQNSSFGEAASLAAMDDYNVRGSTDEQLDTRLSTDTWMRLSAARSSIASLERDLHERKLGTSSTLLPQAHSETVPVSESSDDEEDFHESIANAGNSATDAVRRAIERISDNGFDNVAETGEPKRTTRVAWNLPPRDVVLPSNQSAFSASDATGSMLHSTDPSYLDPSFWLTSFGAQLSHHASAESSVSEGETHAPQVSNISVLPQSPQAARESQSTRSSISASSASASNSSIRDAIESYRKATMFVMPADISSDSSDDDVRNFAAHQNVVISSDSESEQSEHLDSTVDYLNRRVRIERDQLLQTAGNRARSSQAMSHYNIEPQSQRLSSKPQSHRRVVFADSPAAKALNSRAVPHELKYVHIVAETQRRWKNLPEVQRQMHAQESAKSLEASRQKAKFDAEIFRLSLLAKQNMRKPPPSTPPSRPFKP